MADIASVLYGAVVYILFLATSLYAVAVVGDLPVPKTIDSGESAPIVPALIVDVLLLGLFAIQRRVMARPGFKRWWTLHRRRHQRGGGRALCVAGARTIQGYTCVAGSRLATRGRPISG
jgi:hypothetical protein